MLHVQPPHKVSHLRGWTWGGKGGGHSGGYGGGGGGSVMGGVGGGGGGGGGFSGGGGGWYGGGGGGTFVNRSRVTNEPEIGYVLPLPKHYGNDEEDEEVEEVRAYWGDGYLKLTFMVDDGSSSTQSYENFRYPY